MAESPMLRELFEAVGQETPSPSATFERWRFYVGFVFDGVDFSAKQVLDIGGGVGTYSFYAASMGAEDVLCLEPEAEGGRVRDTQAKFERLRDRLRLPQVRLQGDSLQDWNPGGKTFDVMIMHSSINHLNEKACINLQRDPAAREAYRAIFKKLGDISRPGATVVAVDCSKYNLLAHLHLKNPFAPSIEWEKHQSPYFWAKLLSEAGFDEPCIRWSSFNALGSLGRVFLGNALGAYLTTSGFCLTMTKQ